MSLTARRLIIANADFSDVALSSQVLKSIAMTTAPTKTSYTIGEAFDPTGMVITATLQDTSTGDTFTETITTYTYEPSDTFTVTGNITITISYTRGSITKTCTTTVSVHEASSGYTISTSLTNGSATGDSTIAEGGTAALTLVPNEANELPESITVNNATFTYNNITGEVTLSAPTNNVTISGTCPTRVTQNLGFSLPGGYSRETSQVLSLNIRGTYYGNLHKGDIIELVDEPYGGLDWAICIDTLSGTSGTTYDSTAPDSYPSYTENPLRQTGRWVVSRDQRVALTCCYLTSTNPVKANTDDLASAAMTKIFKVTWANSRNANNPMSDTGTVPAVSYTITGNVTNGRLTGATALVEGSTATVTIEPTTGCSLPDTITVTNAQYTYNSTTGIVVLSNGTGNVTVTAVCEGEIPATENLTFSIGAYTWDSSTYAPNTKIRATYFGNLHAGDVLSISPNAKAGTQYQYVFGPLAGTSGHQSADNTVRQAWADAGVQVTGMPNAHYEDVPVTIPLDGRVAVTIKDNNAASTDISTSELAKIFQITWIDPTDPTNDPVSKP